MAELRDTLVVMYPHLVPSARLERRRDRRRVVIWMRREGESDGDGKT